VIHDNNFIASNCRHEEALKRTHHSGHQMYRTKSSSQKEDWEINVMISLQRVVHDASVRGSASLNKWFIRDTSDCRRLSKVVRNTFYFTKDGIGYISQIILTVCRTTINIDRQARSCSIAPGYSINYTHEQTRTNKKMTWFSYVTVRNLA